MPTQSSMDGGSRAILVALTIGVVLLVAGAMAAPEPQRAVPTDNLQRSLLLDNYRIVADSGAGRGEVIYAFKCWMCHNKYTKTAPYLQDVYQRMKDDVMTAKIKDGGPGMPAFRFSLSDSDIAD